MPEQLIVDEVEPGLLVLTMNQPDKLNPLSTTLVGDLHDALEEIGRSTAVRAVVLTGAGRGFCSGAELRAQDQRAAPAADQNPMAHVYHSQERIASLHERIHRLRVPVIAAVNGPAVGGGFSLALACDVRFAAASARFGAVFIKVGVSAADMGTSYFLPRLVGVSRAAELMLTGRIFDAAEAREMGLVLDVVDDGKVVDRALETARQIAANPPFAVWMTKQTLWDNVDAGSLRNALDNENRTQVMCTGSGEMDRAVTAFVEKGRPAWMSL